MLMFCPICANVLVVEEGENCFRFACSTCPYIRNMTKKLTSRRYPKLKEVDDVLGGAAAWDNVDKTKASCPNSECGGSEAYFMQLQTRSADEPMTTFYKCCDCGNRWKDG